MLQELLVEGLGVIERAEIALDEGTTALTGETGAGKTLLVAAVGLLLGGRADRALVRQDSGEARIEGRFGVPAGHPAREVLAQHGVIDAPDDEPAELVVFRTVGMTGGGRIRLNGRMATAQLVQEVTASLVEIAGQHEHQRISTPAHQRRLLDEFAGATALAHEVAEAVRRSTAARARIADLTAEEAELERERERLRFEIDEIEGASFEAGEWERLSTEAKALEGAERSAVALNAACDALRGDGGAAEALRSAVAALRDMPQLDDALVQRLEAASVEVDDIADDLIRTIVEPDPERLAEARERLDQLARLRRRFGGDDDAVMAHLEQARARLAELDAAAGDKATLESELREQSDRAQSAAAELSRARSRAAQRLGDQVTTTLGRLAMGGSRFEVRIEPRDLYEGGTESVTFQIAGGGGAALPLAKVASGGELSRMALALHLAVRRTGAPTTIFDEVDAGIGGEAALAVGEALAELGREPGRQVLVVTHLPQVAARASAHHRVVKEMVGARVRTRVERVEGDDRIEEVSRMLAGMPGSERAREHAQELLQLARG